jgi:hypothetical protein
MYQIATPHTQLSETDAATMRQMAKWARFIGIFGLVASALMVLFAVLVNTMMSTVASRQLEAYGMPEFFDLRFIGTLYSVGFFLAAAIYFLPALLLYQFGSRTLRSLAGEFRPDTFSNALHAHRRLYKFMGILLIIMLLFYAGILFLVVFGAMAGSWSN